MITALARTTEPAFVVGVVCALVALVLAIVDMATRRPILILDIAVAILSLGCAVVFWKIAVG